MTDRRSPNPARLGEIRRRARNPEAAEASAPGTEARKRRRFGPLLYSTLVFAAICIIYLGALRLEELADSAGRVPIKVDPEKEAAAALANLTANTWQARMEGAKALGDLLRIHGPGDKRSAAQGLAVSALRRALGDQDGPVRAAAAAALGVRPQTARAAKHELTAALKDEDITVRLSAAQALLTIGDDSKTPALRALAQLVADPTPLSERLASLDSMARAGAEGQAAAVAAFVRRLSNAQEPVGDQEIRGASLLEPEMLLAALEPLFSSDDARSRTAAALIAVSLSLPAKNSTGNVGPMMQLMMQSVSSPAPMPTSLERNRVILEHAVIDMSFRLDQREAALQALYSIGARGPLRRCGLELARQLAQPDASSRTAAALLLHMIDPDTLAGINDPDEIP